MAKQGAQAEETETYDRGSLHVVDCAGCRCKDQGNFNDDKTTTTHNVAEKMPTSEA